MEDIVVFKPPREMALSAVRVLMLGHVGSGKSSFYNTDNSVLKCRISQRARIGKSEHSITSAYTPHVTKSRSESMLNFRLCDTRSLEVTKGLNSIVYIECNYLQDGHVPDYYEFNPAVPISLDTNGFVEQPSFADKINCVAFVINASSIEHIPPKLVKKMINTQQIMNRKGIPQVVLLSKVDLECRRVASNVFESACIKEAVEKVSTMFGLQFNNILPVKNYVSQMELDVDTSILALLALMQILYLTEDYMEGLQEKMKRVKVSTVNCVQPSEKANNKE